MKTANIDLVIVYLLAAIVPCAIMPCAMARDLEQDEALRLREKGEIIALETIIEMASKRYPNAKVLEVELEEENDIYQYEVELLTEQGHVRELEVDARSGKILVDEADD